MELRFTVQNAEALCFRLLASRACGAPLWCFCTGDTPVALNVGQAFSLRRKPFGGGGRGVLLSG